MTSEKQLESARKWKQRNAEKVKAKRAEYYAVNKDRELMMAKVWREHNPELLRALKKHADAAYRKAHPEKIKAKRRVYKAKKAVLEKRRYAEDPKYSLTKRLRSSLCQSLRLAGVRKTHKTFDLIGCSPQQLKEHIESQFVGGMSWDRRNEIHIDHIKPVASFDLSDVEQQKACFHYSNLRPLWAVDNLSRPKVWRQDIIEVS